MGLTDLRRVSPTPISPSRTSVAVLSLVLVALLHVPLAWAQSADPTAPPAAVGIGGARPVGVALRTSEAPAIDGVFDERMWREAIPLTDFIQAEPFEGQPASQKSRYGGSRMRRWSNAAGQARVVAEGLLTTFATSSHSICE